MGFKIFKIAIFKFFQRMKIAIFFFFFFFYDIILFIIRFFFPFFWNLLVMRKKVFNKRNDELYKVNLVIAQ
jgi:hypothetical protein